jgi:hypothetical protein
MKKLLFILLFVLIISNHTVLAQDSITVSIKPKHIDGKMGDVIEFESNVTNNGTVSLKGLVVYISLIKVTEGQEIPMDLEDWSAQKADKIDLLNPNDSASSKWSMRLIDSGDYVVYMTVVDKNRETPIVSEVAELKIARRQQLNPNNVLPIAFGMPILIILTFLSIGIYRRLRR